MDRTPSERPVLATVTAGAGGALAALACALVSVPPYGATRTSLGEIPWIEMALAAIVFAGATAWALAASANPWRRFAIPVLGVTVLRLPMCCLLGGLAERPAENLPTVAWCVWLLRDLLLGLSMLPFVHAALGARDDRTPGPGITVLLASSGWLSGLGLAVHWAPPWDIARPAATLCIGYALVVLLVAATSEQSLYAAPETDAPRPPAGPYREGDAPALDSGRGPVLPWPRRLLGRAGTAVGALLAGLLFVLPLQIFREGDGLPPGPVAQAFPRDRVVRAERQGFPGVTLWRVQPQSSLPELVGYDEARRAVLRRDALVRSARRSGRFSTDTLARIASEAYACDALATGAPAEPPSLRGGVLVFWCQRLDAGPPVRFEVRVGP